MLAKLCRACGRTSVETLFARLSTRHCADCTEVAKAARAARLAERGRRVLAARPQPRPGANRKHLNWIKLQPCAVRRGTCSGVMHPHHIRSANTAGTGMLPPDCFAVPLCASHHAEGHHRGWRTFEAKYGVDLLHLALWLARTSPYLAEGV